MLKPTKDQFLIYTVISAAAWSLDSAFCTGHIGSEEKSSVEENPDYLDELSLHLSRVVPRVQLERLRDLAALAVKQTDEKTK